MDFQTRPIECARMVSMIPGGVTTVLEPTPGEGNLVMALKNAGYRVVSPRDFWSISGKFDAVVMNPPFSPMETGYKILYATMEMTDIIIALMPWLTIINSEKRTRDIVGFGLRSITHLPRTAFMGARVQTCILSMEKGFCGTTEMHFAQDVLTRMPVDNSSTVVV